MSDTPPSPQPAPRAPEAPPSGLAHTPPSGAGSWLTFLVLLVPIPFVMMVPWLILAVIAHRGAKRYGGPAQANARNALNWCLTVVGPLVGLLAASVLSLFIGGQVRAPASVQLSISDPFAWPFLIFVTALFVFGLLVLINGIRGAVGASKGRVVVAFPTIPFVKQPGVR